MLPGGVKWSATIAQTQPGNVQLIDVNLLDMEFIHSEIILKNGTHHPTNWRFVDW